MTKEDIIRMAQEAGLFHFYDSEGHCDGITDARLVTEDKERWDDRLVEMLAPFAALVAAAEREACAKVCECKMPNPVQNWADAQIVNALRDCAATRRAIVRAAAEIGRSMT